VANDPPTLRSYGRADRVRLSPPYSEKINTLQKAFVYTGKYYFLITIIHTASLSTRRFNEVLAQEKKGEKKPETLIAFIYC
jgi:hypothetical protein